MQYSPHTCAGSTDDQRRVFDVANAACPGRQFQQGWRHVVHPEGMEIGYYRGACSYVDPCVQVVPYVHDGGLCVCHARYIGAPRVLPVWSECHGGLLTIPWYIFIFRGTGHYECA